MKKLLSVFPIVVLLATGCNLSQQDSSAAPDSTIKRPAISNINPTPALTGIKNPDMASALQFIYGNYNSATKTSQWTITNNDLDLAVKNNVFDFEASSTIGTQYTVSAYASTLTSDGDFLILTQTLPDERNSGHASAATIGAFDFYKSGGIWVLRISERAFIEAGAWGEAPKTVSVVKYGQDDYAFKLEGGDMHFGYSDSYILLLAPLQDHFAPIFTYADANDNNDGAYGGTPVYSYSSTMEFIPVKDSQYYDIQIITKGTRLGSQKHLQNFIHKRHERLLCPLYR